MESGAVKWLDCENPSRELLEQLAERLKLPKKVLYNCLDSDYLPHIETYGQTHFIILRLMEPETKISANSIQELTTKIALFMAPGLVVSIHRLQLAEVDEIWRKLENHLSQGFSGPQLLNYFFEQASLGFEKPLSLLEEKVETFENSFFQIKKSRGLMQEGFYIKRKAAVYRKVLKMTLELLIKSAQKIECGSELYQAAKDRLERNLFYAEEVSDGMQSLLNLHLAMESQKTNEASLKTNETVRVLTVLSIFFLPLNFLAGLFGMNFNHIPLLNHPWGFWISLLMMLLISIFLAYYVTKQGWIIKPDLKSGEKK